MGKRTHRQAFSLVELAIVLAVIGLIAGGVMEGMTMMRVSALNRVVSDAKLYATSKEQFREKYGELPGDYPQATSTWTSTNLNNGNGDGTLIYATAVNGTAEIYQFWKHLALAGYIGGDYTGLNGPAQINYDTVPGVNSPLTAIDGATFWMYPWPVYPTDNGTFFAGNYLNTMVLGGRLVGNWPYANILTGAEAASMDKKVDDGSPAFGGVRAMGNTWSTTQWGVGCATTDVATTAVYNLASTQPVCILLFMPSFQASS